MIPTVAVPSLLQHFVATVLLSFLIGLEFHSYRRANHTDLSFGTTRTFTMIGMLGYTLYVLDGSWRLYMLGMLALSGFLWIHYWRRVKVKQAKFSLLSPLLAISTYLLGPASVLLPGWFLILFVVILLLLLSEKPIIRSFSNAFSSEEASTLSKFLIMAGVVLPLLPNKQIATYIPITYYQVWLAVIVVSGISYLSYLAQTYFFKERGVLLTGMLGGLYSSTATTVVIARHSVSTPNERVTTPSIILATAMMYIRLLVLIALLGYLPIAVQLLPPFTLFIASSGIVSFAIYRMAKTDTRPEEEHEETGKHPLELLTAFTFAFLFLFFATLTHFVLARFGAGGLHLLSFLVGFSDIDPFILSLLAGKFQVHQIVIVGAILMATGSNNLLKAIYAVIIGRNRSIVLAASWLILLFVATIGYIFFFL